MKLVPALLIPIALLVFPVAGDAQERRGARERGDTGPGSAWEVLKKNHDKNGDGKISAKEYTRGEVQFRRLDADDDGFITEDDVRSRGRGRGGRGGPGQGRGQRGGFAGRMLGRAADSDEDGAVSAKEWKAFLGSLEASEDGVIPSEKVAKLIPERARGRGRNMADRMARMLDRDDDGQLELSDLQMIFASLDGDEDGALSSDELGGSSGGPGGRRRPGGDAGDRRGGDRPRGDRDRADSEGPPQAGDTAPDFTLPFADDTKKTVSLSSFAGKRPVALIFGSYT